MKTGKALVWIGSLVILLLVIDLGFFDRGQSDNVAGIGAIVWIFGIFPIYFGRKMMKKAGNKN